MQKEKRKYLSFSDKLNIIKLVKDGKSSTQVRKQFGISMTTLFCILKNKKEIVARSNDYKWKNKKTKRSCDNQLLEEALFTWYCQKRCMGEYVSGPNLQEQARIFNEKLNGSSGFKASNGWLGKFKLRHNIKDARDLKLKDIEAENNFQQIITNKIENEGFLLDNIYNADETGLQWRDLPKRTLMTLCKKSSIDKLGSDKVTVLLCSNANGTHKLPLLVIGKLSNNNVSNNFSCLPVIYKCQEKGLMEQPIFQDWYTTNFIPTVLENQNIHGTYGKVLLILDHAPSHLHANVLNKIHDNFEILYLPPNVTLSLQPMNQGLITLIKQNLRKAILKNLFLHHLTVEDYLASTNLQDCFQMIASIWAEIKKDALQKCWNPLLYNIYNFTFDDYNHMCDIVSNSIKILNTDATEINEWIENDDVDQGWELMTDDNIIEIINNRPPVKKSMLREPVKVEVKEEILEQECSTVEYISTEEAYNYFRKGYTWLQMQEECTATDLINLSKIIALINKKLIRKDCKRSLK